MTMSQETVKKPGDNLSPQARRALEEAAQRRAAKPDQTRPTELNGRKGPEATRFGDWEKNGIASDF